MLNFSRGPEINLRYSTCTLTLVRSFFTFKKSIVKAPRKTKTEENKNKIILNRSALGTL